MQVSNITHGMVDNALQLQVILGIVLVQFSLGSITKYHSLVQLYKDLFSKHKYQKNNPIIKMKYKEKYLMGFGNCRCRPRGRKPLKTCCLSAIFYC